MPARLSFNASDLKRQFYEAQAAAAQARKGLVTGTHTLEETEATLRHFYQAESELRWGPKGPPPGYINHRVGTEMRELRRTYERYNTPAARAKAVAKAKEREAKVAAKEKERKAKAAAKDKERKSKVDAKAQERDAMNKLKAAEDGALKGTHTLRQVEAAATKALTLQFGPPELFLSKVRPGLFRTSKLRYQIAHRHMDNVYSDVLEGRRTLEEAEKATADLYRIQFEGRRADEIKLRAMVEAKLSPLRKEIEVRRKRVNPEENRLRSETDRMEAMRNQLSARAADEKLPADARRAAQRELQELEERASEIKYNLAMRKADAIAMRALQRGESIAAAQAAFEFESEARREFEQIWAKNEVTRAKVRLESEIKGRVDRVRSQIEGIERKKKYQEQLIKDRERAKEQAKLRAQKDREERKLRAEKERKERKIRAQKEREQRGLREEEARKRYLREEAAEERRRKQQKKAADSLVRAEAERVKKSGKGEICEYRLVMSELWGRPEERATLSKVCIDQHGTVSRAAANGLHPLTGSLLASWSLISIPTDKVGRAVLDTLGASLKKCEPGDGYLINVVRDLEQNSRGLPLDDYLELLERTQIWMMNTSARWHSLHDVKRIKQELLAALNEMPEAFEKPALPFFLLS